MKDQLHNLRNEAISLILSAKHSKELEEIRIQFLGRNGSLTLLLKEIVKLPAAEKPEMGRAGNEVKNIIEDTLSRKMQEVGKNKSSLTQNLDVTEPGIRPPLGHLHLITQAIEEITTIFERIGFSRVRYPEIEWDWYAFTSLNFPENHPARDDWETFFIEQDDDPKYGPVVLTPHTSSGQVREMERVLKSRPHPHPSTPVSLHSQAGSLTTFSPPLKGEGVKRSGINIKMLNIAKCYRRQSDISHTPMFHQFEGLVVGEQIAISDLKGTLDYFVKSYFGGKRTARIRPYHFQFTEPSFEVDVTCGVCLGKGCKLCKEGWLELGGSGMVHPNVLRNGGIDPQKYTGFAFGWGVERVLMMKEGLVIDDLRLLYSNDLDFLQQF